MSSISNENEEGEEMEDSEENENSESLSQNEKGRIMIIYVSVHLIKWK